MTTILALLVVAVALYLVGYPLFKPATADGYGMDEDQLEKNKEAVFTTLNELEFDFRMGKVSDEDYQKLRRKYRAQAAQILKSEDEGDFGFKPTGKAVKIDQALQDEIEAELKALKNQGTEQ